MWVAQQRALAQDGIRVSDTHSFQIPEGAALPESEGLFQLSIGDS